MEYLKAKVRDGVCRRGVLALALTGALGARADSATVRVGYIRSLIRRPVISLLEQRGRTPAWRAMDDNNTTGSSLGQSFELVDVPVRKDANLLAVLDRLAGQDVRPVMPRKGCGVGGVPVRNLSTRRQ